MKNTDKANGMTFNDYYEFIRLNCTLTNDEVLEVANYCWNRNIDKYSALEIARDN